MSEAQASAALATACNAGKSFDKIFTLPVATKHSFA